MKTILSRGDNWNLFSLLHEYYEFSLLLIASEYTIMESNNIVYTIRLQLKNELDVFHLSLELSCAVLEIKKNLVKQTDTFVYTGLYVTRY